MNYFRKIGQYLCCEDQRSAQNHQRHILTIHSFSIPSNRTSTSSRNQLTIQKYMNDVNSQFYIYGPIKPTKKVIVARSNKKKLLLIDLDKTLIFYSEEKGLIVRPQLKRFLKKVHEFYDIFIFTAAVPNYLNEMLIQMAECKCGVQYFSGFLTRQNCIQVHLNSGKTGYIKDINVINNCDFSKTVVVDDTPISYILNPDNAVPIYPFEGLLPDNHLGYLCQTLMEIKDYDDVREYIKDRYLFDLPCQTTITNTTQSSDSSASVSPNKEVLTS